MNWLFAFALALLTIGIIYAVIYLGIKFPYLVLTFLIIILICIFTLGYHDQITTGGF